MKLIATYESDGETVYINASRVDYVRRREGTKHLPVQISIHFGKSVLHLAGVAAETFLAEWDEIWEPPDEYEPFEPEQAEAS